MDTMDDVLIETKNGKLMYKQSFLRNSWKNTSRERSWWKVGHSANRGSRANCDVCKQKIEYDTLRFSRCTANPFDANGGMTDLCKHYHADCAATILGKSRCTTKMPTRANLKDFTLLSKGEQTRVNAILHEATKTRDTRCQSKSKSLAKSIRNKQKTKNK
jgi:hypothetical protein